MLLKTENLSKAYHMTGSRKEVFYAVKDVNINVFEGETLGLLGDSGSGKTTVGQIITGLIQPTSGRILYKGKEIKFPVKRSLRKQIQILFQHPEISFNPELPIIKSMEEPYKLYRPGSSKNDIIKDIEKLGLKEKHLYRKPRELSGGELQRLALSRILALEPKLIILDEATSMLDVISQAQIAALLKTYQKENNTAYIFITHNKALADIVCNRIYRIDKGICTEEDI